MNRRLLAVAGIIVIGLLGMAAALTPVFMFPRDTVDVICVEGGLQVGQVTEANGNEVLPLQCRGGGGRTRTPSPEPTEVTPSPTPTEVTVTPSPSPTPTEITPTPTEITPTPTDTPPPGGDPYPGAPLCASHDPEAYHGLWNSAEGCHYDHEHGEEPFSSPLYGIFSELTAGQEISYPWQTPNENALKHYGYKFDWRMGIPCAGREGSRWGVSGFLIERHGVGDYNKAMATPFHSFASAIVICDVQTGEDLGVMAVGGKQNFGQRVSPYQGEILSYDYAGEMASIGATYSPYVSGREPYFSQDCVGAFCNRNLGNVTGNTTWISEPVNLFGNELLAFLFRSRDTHTVINGESIPNPEFLYICSDDGGQTFRQENCTKNNSTGAVHEIMGRVPEEWDALDGVEDGFVTLRGFTDSWGRLVIGCTEAGPDCIPLILENVPVGFKYGMQDSGNRNPFSIAAIPDYDIYFCGSEVCTETSVGAVPSGWPSLDN